MTLIERSCQTEGCPNLLPRLCTGRRKFCNTCLNRKYRENGQRTSHKIRFNIHLAEKALSILTEEQRERLGV